jgi:hypothetical protein
MVDSGALAASQPEELPERDQYTARVQSSGDGLDAALAVNFRCSRWTKVFTQQCLALGVTLWVPRSRWLLDWWRAGSSKQLTHGCNTGRTATPSRCPNCGFASLLLYPFLLSRTRVGVWDTSTLFVQVDFSKAGRWNMAGEPPLFSGNGPNGQALPHCGTCASLRGAFNVLPVAELLVVDARTLPQATEYQEQLAGAEKS